MALQWLILEYVVVAEAVIVLLLTLPWPKKISSQIVALTSKVLQPLASLIPFAVFNLLDLYWKICLLYWFTHKICKYHKEIKELEAVEKRAKNL